MQRDVKIVEVGPRDGLQNESMLVPTAKKIAFINQLSMAGLSVIEATSFVSAEKIPQTADAFDVYTGIEKHPESIYPVLVPNLEGYNNARAAGVTEIAVFTACSESFSMRNTHCSIEESFARIEAVIAQAKQDDVHVRGYLSCCLGCPYEGEIELSVVTKIAQRLYQAGCYEISLGDTIGIGTPNQAAALIKAVKQVVPVSQLAAHFHDTYGQAIANLYAALEQGIRIIDSSVAGLGGCPYAKGATGNVATEDVIYLLNGLGFSHGLDLAKLSDIGQQMCDFLQRDNQSRVAKALLRRKA